MILRIAAPGIPQNASRSEAINRSSSSRGGPQLAERYSLYKMDMSAHTCLVVSLVWTTVDCEWTGYLSVEINVIKLYGTANIDIWG